MVMLVMVMGGELAAAKSRVAQVEEGGQSRFFKTLPTLPQVDALIRFSNSHISFSNSSYEKCSNTCLKAGKWNASSTHSVGLRQNICLIILPIIADVIEIMVMMKRRGGGGRESR